MKANTLIESAKALIEEYNVKLAEYNIICSLSKKYFEVSVPYQSIKGLEYLIMLNKEKKTYKGQKNRYYYVIICFSPAQNNLVKKSDCKEYAFIVRKVERVHIGLKPEETIYQEEKVLKKIEKRIQKTLQKAKTQDAVKICKDSSRDFLRYMFSGKYDHKKILFGKPRSFWETVLSVVVISILILFVLAAWLYTTL